MSWNWSTATSLSQKSTFKKQQGCKPILFHNVLQALCLASRHRIGHPYSALESINAAVVRTTNTFTYLGVFGRSSKSGFLQQCFYHVTYGTRNIIATGAGIILFVMVCEQNVKIINRCRANIWHENANPKVTKQSRGRHPKHETFILVSDSRLCCNTQRFQDDLLLKFVFSAPTQNHLFYNAFWTFSDLDRQIITRVSAVNGKRLQSKNCVCT